MTDAALEQALLDPGIIRNRRKVYATRQNARIFLLIQQEFGSFDQYLAHFVPNAPIIHHCERLSDLPTTIPESITLSRDLQARGMSFVGPTILYAFMQAVGLVFDHLTTCWKAPS